MLDLRPARIDHPDALLLNDEVQQYYVEIYGGPDHDPAEPDDFLPPQGGFLLGYEEDVPVAMGGWSFLSGSRTAVKLRRMYVRREARRHGYAAALLDALEDDARRAGAQRIALTTGEPQQAAIRFYRARGYEEIPAFGFYAAETGAVHLGKAL